MSFTSTVKNEVSKIEEQKVEQIAELSALLRNSSEISDIIKITTENSSVARLIFNSLKSLYAVTPKITVRNGYNYSKKYIYILELSKKVEEIKKDLCLDVLIPKDYLIDDDITKRAYLRGVFLSSGSVNDPKKSRYHLEFFVNDSEYASFISNLINGYDLNSKVIKKDNKYMIYVKEAEKIGDFLRMIHAIQALFYYEDIRIYRDHKNMTNRLNNCEQANVDKIIESAMKQVDDIELINSVGGLDLLSEKEQVVAVYRMKYKEASLQELSEIITLETGNKITKSGLNHRFKKIKDLALKIKEKSN